jgi:hypothetical protein
MGRCKQKSPHMMQAFFVAIARQRSAYVNLAQICFASKQNVRDGDLLTARARFLFGFRRFTALFHQFSEATGAGKHRATGDFARFSAADNGGLFARPAKAGPTARYGALAWRRRLLAEFSDLVCIEKAHRVPDIRPLTLKPCRLFKADRRTAQPCKMT